jgi:hypothetical protein
LASLNTKIAELLLTYKNDPILAIESLFSVKLDDQQKALVLGAQDPNARVAVKSSQGAGKTSCLVWMTLYYLLTLEDCRILITAPSAQQLNRVFHSETQKWYARLPEIFKPFFDIKKESIHIKGKEYQMASLVTGNPSNIEGLQGGHATNYIIMGDEASGLEELVFDTLLGTLGAGDGRFIMTSNPVRNSGRFYEIFANENKNWVRLTFNAMDSAVTSQRWIEEMREMYNELDDNWQIRVLGNFGRYGEQQFIPSNVIETCVQNYIEYKGYSNYTKVAGVDVARFGADQTVLTLRQGSKILDITKYSGLDTMEVAARVVDYHHRFSPSIIYIDSIGIGAGVYDRTAELGLPVKEVIVSQSSNNPKMYGNFRAQLWGEMRDWMHNGGDLPDDKDLISQLNSMQYTYNNKMQILLMSKKDIKKLGLPSPDIADSIALTFAGNVYSANFTRTAKRNIRKSNFHWV